MLGAGVQVLGAGHWFGVLAVSAGSGLLGAGAGCRLPSWRWRIGCLRRLLLAFVSWFPGGCSWRRGQARAAELSRAPTGPA